jgi:hypothetical protein
LSIRFTTKKCSRKILSSLFRVTIFILVILVRFIALFIPALNWTSVAFIRLATSAFINQTFLSELAANLIFTLSLFFYNPSTRAFLRG